MMPRAAPTAYFDADAMQITDNSEDHVTDIIEYAKAQLDPGRPNTGYSALAASAISHALARQHRPAHPDRSPPVKFTAGFDAQEAQHLQLFRAGLKKQTFPVRLHIPLGVGGNHETGLIVDIDKNGEAEILFFNSLGNSGKSGRYFDDASKMIAIVNEVFPVKKKHYTKKPFQDLGKSDMFCGDWTTWFLKTAAQNAHLSLAQLAQTEVGVFNAPPFGELRKQSYELLVAPASASPAPLASSPKFPQEEWDTDLDELKGPDFLQSMKQLKDAKPGSEVETFNLKKLKDHYNSLCAQYHVSASKADKEVLVTNIQSVIQQVLSILAPPTNPHKKMWEKAEEFWSEKAALADKEKARELVSEAFRTGEPIQLDGYPEAFQKTIAQELFIQAHLDFGYVEVYPVHSKDLTALLAEAKVAVEKQYGNVDELLKERYRANPKRIDLDCFRDDKLRVRALQIYYQESKGASPFTIAAKSTDLIKSINERARAGLQEEEKKYEPPERQKEEEKAREEPVPTGPVTPTLVAKGAKDTSLGDVKKPVGEPLPLFLRQLDLPIPAELKDYAEWARNIAHWTWLAKGSWGELDKVPQARQHCAALLARLSGPEFADPDFQEMVTLESEPEEKSAGKVKTSVNMLTLIRQSLQATEQQLGKLQASGPEKTYVFCDSHQSDPKEAFTELKQIAPALPLTSLDHLQNPVLCTVGSGEFKSAFVQGVRHADPDKPFVSEAYLSDKLNSNEDKLREAVFALIITFRADPRNDRKKIIFKGDFSAEFLALATSLCNRLDYSWDVNTTLKEKTLAGTYSGKKEAMANLLDHVERDPKAEADWQDWIKKNNKYPFSVMLEQSKVKELEGPDHLKLKPQTVEAAAEAKAASLALAHSYVITPATWIEARPPPVPASESRHDLKITTNPRKDPSRSVTIGTDESDAPVHDAAEEEEESKDEHFASLSMIPKK